MDDQAPLTVYWCRRLAARSPMTVAIVAGQLSAGWGAQDATNPHRGCL